MKYFQKKITTKNFQMGSGLSLPFHFTFFTTLRKVFGNFISAGVTKRKKNKQPVHTLKWLILGWTPNHRNHTKADNETALLFSGSC